MGPWPPKDSLTTTQLLATYATVSAPFLAAFIFFFSCSLNKELKFLFRIIISL